MKTHLYHLLSWAILCTMTVSCDKCSKEEPAPEKVCKLLYEGSAGNTYEYNSNDQLVQLSNSGGSIKYTYDENGFLTEKIWGSTIYKYEYANGLLTKVIYPQSFKDSENTYEYDSQNRLTKAILTLKNGQGTIVTNYNNGKIISLIQNIGGTITQPNQYENGKVIRSVQVIDQSYNTIDYDAKGRQVRYTKYDGNGKIIGYREYTYEDGIPSENADPEIFFKGFPDEIKDIRPNGLRKTAFYYEMQNNSKVKTSETISTHILNAKGYVTSTTNNSSYLNTEGVWITKNPSKVTYSYINCDE